MPVPIDQSARLHQLAKAIATIASIRISFDLSLTFVTTLLHENCCSCLTFKHQQVGLQCCCYKQPHIVTIPMQTTLMLMRKLDIPLCRDLGNVRKMMLTIEIIQIIPNGTEIKVDDNDTTKAEIRCCTFE